MCLGTQQIQAVRSTRFYSWSPLPAQLAARNSRVCAITGAACAPHTEDRKPPHLLSTTLLSRHRSGRGGAETTSTRGHRRSPSSLATPPPPPPAQLLRAKPSRLEGGAAARPCQHSDEGEPQAVEDERVDPLLFARCALTAVPPALGLAGGRMAAAPSSSRLLPRLISAAPAFPSLIHPRPPATSRRLLDWTRSRLNPAIPRRHRRRGLLSRREKSRRRRRRRSRRAAGRAAALARRIASRGLLASLASPPQQAEDRARRREERLDVVHVY